MSNLDGRTLLALGDSLIYGNRLGSERTWVKLLGQKHGMRVFNYGRNGNTVAVQTKEPTQVPMCVRYREMAEEADYLVILGGANDKRLDVPIGEPVRDNRDPATFAGALNVLLAGVTARYPRARILLMTNYQRWPGENALGLTELAYVDAMLAVSALWSLPCFDNYRRCGLSFQNPAQLAWIDEGLSLGLGENRHLSEEAYRWLVPRYEAVLEGM